MDHPNFLSAGYMAAFAVSGSVVILALQAHKRLLSKFMNQMEFEIGYRKHHEQRRKKVRFADDDGGGGDGGMKKKVGMGIRKNAVQMKKRRRSSIPEHKLEAMPSNWQALYKGILHNRALQNIP